jgi:hypothetical protein
MAPTIALLLQKIAQGGGEEMKKYWRQYQRFPLCIPQGPRTELEGAYEELRLDIIPPSLRGSALPTDGF